MSQLFFIHSYIHLTSIYLSVNTHGNPERTFYKKTPIMGCHFFDVDVNTSYNVILILAIKISLSYNGNHCNP